MKVYIASKYVVHQNINREIYSALKAADIEVFLPESINIDAIDKYEMYIVSEVCFKEIDICDVILVVAPFGKSVSSEIGYSIAQKRLGKQKTIILFNYNDGEDVMKTEAMIAPYIDTVVKNTNELLTYLKDNL